MKYKIEPRKSRRSKEVKGSPKEGEEGQSKSKADPEGPRKLNYIESTKVNGGQRWSTWSRRRKRVGE